MNLFFGNATQVVSAHSNVAHRIIRAQARGGINTIKLEMPEINNFGQPLARRAYTRWYRLSGLRSKLPAREPDPCKPTTRIERSNYQTLDQRRKPRHMVALHLKKWTASYRSSGPKGSRKSALHPVGTPPRHIGNNRLIFGFGRTEYRGSLGGGHPPSQNSTFDRRLSPGPTWSSRTDSVRAAALSLA